MYVQSGMQTFVIIGKKTREFMYHSQINDVIYLGSVGYNSH